jgi:hypothetical protein
MTFEDWLLKHQDEEIVEIGTVVWGDVLKRIEDDYPDLLNERFNPHVAKRIKEAILGDVDNYAEDIGESINELVRQSLEITMEGQS